MGRVTGVQILRPRRLLRFLAQETRDPALPRDTTSGHACSTARGLDLVLYPRGHGQPRSIVNCTTRRSMNTETLFGLSILMSFIASGIVMKLYIWPRLRVMRREDALIPLVIPHTFRFVGLSFLIPGVVFSSLSSAFAIPAAYGDLVAAILA